MYGKINPVKFGLASGVIWAVVLFVMTWISMYSGWAMFWLSQWMDVYPGFALTMQGSFIGLVYGFIHGFVSFFLLGWLYNCFKP